MHRPQQRSLRHCRGPSGGISWPATQPQRYHWCASPNGATSSTAVPACSLSRRSSSLRRPILLGTFTLVWASELAGSTLYPRRSQPAPIFSDAVLLYTGPQHHLTLYGRSQGTYYYRVRAEAEGGTSDWSYGVGVRVAAARRWQLQTVQAYNPDTLLAVQRALLRLCAARGDLLAVLGLPEHYRDRGGHRPYRDPQSSGRAATGRGGCGAASPRCG